MNFYELKPSSTEICLFCRYLYLDIGDGSARKHFCAIHRDVDLDVDMRLLRPNDCRDILHESNDAVTKTFARRNK